MDSFNLEMLYATGFTILALGICFTGVFVILHITAWRDK